MFSGDLGGVDTDCVDGVDICFICKRLSHACPSRCATCACTYLILELLALNSNYGIYPLSYGSNKLDTHGIIVLIYLSENPWMLHFTA